MSITTANPGASGIGSYLSGLQPTPRNLTSAALALARIYELGWVPLGGYCGSDVLWHVHCLVCNDWSGPRFYSHLRRNRPAFRHPGCIAKSEHPAALTKLALRARTTCSCQITHPTTEDDVAATLAAIAEAQIQQDTDRMLAQIDRFLGACPATGARARAVTAHLLTVENTRKKV
ncbi:hypothetical protein [Streptomyces aureocirculatus]|uniref:hypothetical protein n=1 Tax=Streptomyces aureocirculatus TaxID=67275 RepID=UPI0004CBA31C|nr:hypothetical protein [Streptomyces aureocirculatus]